MKAGRDTVPIVLLQPGADFSPVSFTAHVSVPGLCYFRIAWQAALIESLWESVPGVCLSVTFDMECGLLCVWVYLHTRLVSAHLCVYVCACVWGGGGKHCVAVK